MSTSSLPLHASTTGSNPRSIAIIGGGPAGLIAAEYLSQLGHTVTVFDAMPSVGRKFLQAGKGGMNLTHSEPLADFVQRYGEATPFMTPLLTQFGPEALRAWAQGLGFDTFVGSSGRVFPSDMKAAPLLRAWLQRLREQGVTFQVRHRWQGWDDDNRLSFMTPTGERLVETDACLLALGGASWPRLGTTGAWVAPLAARGIRINPLKPSNCGFEMAWSDHFRSRFAGSPLKSVVLTHVNEAGEACSRQGECVVTEHGMEGSLLYPFTPALRDALERNGEARFYLDLLPGRDLNRVKRELSQPRGSKSMANHLRSRLGLEGVKAGLLRECLTASEFSDNQRLATAIKALPVAVIATRPIEEAISSAGGVALAELDPQLMLTQLPGVFCAGEMLDWEAPTGGYLLTGCFATGYQAARGMATWLQSRP